jgi:hypothetical protein
MKEKRFCQETLTYLFVCEFFSLYRELSKSEVVKGRGRVEGRREKEGENGKF